MVLVVDHTLMIVSRSQGCVPAGVGDAAPEVDDELAVVDDGDRGPDVESLVEVGGERVPHAGEPLVTRPLHLDHRAPFG